MAQLATLRADAASPTVVDGLRHDWTEAEIAALFALPFNDLLFQAQTVHRANFDPNRIQISRLLSIKTGKCPQTKRDAVDPAPNCAA